MTIEIIESVSEMSERATEWSFSRDVALVPTMGSLHEGHISLVREAASQAKIVVVSIFVNPLQFSPTEDFEKYPRNIKRDAELLATAGAHYIFAPLASDVTPPDMTFSVDPGSMGNVLCGKYRPGHFKGVCTIVTKLFQIIQPGQAVFGWKDAQQFQILRKMVADLNMPVRLSAVETGRETDGLAMSSRNSYLTKSQRTAAPAIHRALLSAWAAFDAGTDSTEYLLDIFKQSIEAEPQLQLQYAAAVATDTLEPVDTVQPGNTLIAVAVYAGETRLIDNIRL